MLMLMLTLMLMMMLMLNKLSKLCTSSDSRKLRHFSMLGKLSKLSKLRKLRKLSKPSKLRYASHERVFFPQDERLYDGNKFASAAAQQYLRYSRSGYSRLYNTTHAGGCTALSRQNIVSGVAQHRKQHGGAERRGSAHILF